MTPVLQSVVFGVLAALAMGASDFVGGWAARRSPFPVVIASTHACGLLSITAFAALRGVPWPSSGSLGWAAGSGVAAFVGLAALYRAMAVGRIGLVAPVSGVVAAAVPVVLTMMAHGLPASGQLVGFGLGMVGIWLIAQSSEAGSGLRGLGEALLAGAAFGAFFVTMARVEGPSMPWSLAAARVVSCLLATALVFARGPSAFASARPLFPVLALAGGLEVSGVAFFAVASQSGRLDVASVVSSLYPIPTIVLARIVLRERMNRTQITGIVAASAAIALIVAG